jgi:chromosome segregation ATPase
MDIRSIEAKKRLVEEKREQINRAIGKRDSIVERLAKEFNVTIEEAPAKLQELIAKRTKIETKLDKIEEELNNYDW